MRSSIGLLLVPALVFGGCADDTDAYIPQIPGPPSVAEVDEPMTHVVIEIPRRLERPDTVDIEVVTPGERARALGHLARARYDRLHGAGIVR